MATTEETGHASRGENYAQDGTMDLHCEPVSRSMTGTWTACSFIVVHERIAFDGISANLVPYLTKKLHQGTVKSANNVTNWVGATWLTPILAAFIADAYLNRCLAFVSASVFLNRCLAFVSASVFYFMTWYKYVTRYGPVYILLIIYNNFLPLLASNPQPARFTVGCGGAMPLTSAFGADQFDDFSAKKRTKNSPSSLVDVQPFLWHKVPCGNPFTKVANVLAAAARKWKAALPNNPRELYELSLKEYAKKERCRIEYNPSLRYYAFLAVLASLNFLFFLLFSKLFVYNTEVGKTKMDLAMETLLREANSPRDNEETMVDLVMKPLRNETDSPTIMKIVGYVDN
ncbi:hypothetical protein FEM48_Zijuj09G0061800 [Ziziphus jujuba var. spinosa]|uniref:Uncharacterized protein n=1 Tax=Ziziphus jujuba var. spinosa TaxID=714518 RepID=A0A978URC2_ZIZJJ|nr:hypothetical protein FEM48_Zijuj09G0061800 [Ziziphus jujuba var. spinosa]